MEMLTANALRQDGSLPGPPSICHYSLSLPEDRQTKQQQGGGGLFYKAQDIVRLSLAIN